MILVPVAWRFILAAMFALLFSGCFPPSENAFEEEKDPNFLEGKNLLRSRDFKGAIESFEKALQANPNSASAHFELGVLYQEKENDPASAIYHYEKLLRLKPKSSQAELVKPQITACKVELAKSVSFSVVTREVQRDMERLDKENKALRLQGETLRAQLAQKPNFITNYVTNILVKTQYVSAPSSSVSTAAPPAATRVVTPPAARTPAPSARTPVPVPAPGFGLNPGSASPTRTNRVSSPSPTPRTAERRRTEAPAPARTAPPTRVTHTVKVGETPFSIAHNYGVSVQALMAANPGASAKRLQAGQVLVIPSNR